MARQRDSKGRYLPGPSTAVAPRKLRRDETLNPDGTISRRSRGRRGRCLPANIVNTPKVLKNHFILVCDGSGSMSAHRSGAARLFNEQLDVVQNTQDQKNSVTVFHFGVGHTGIREVRYNVAPSMVDRFTASSYPASGNTPLYDAVLQAGQRALCDNDPDKSFVMVVLTDGEENASTRYGSYDLQKFIREQQATDRWTFVFLVPRGYKSKFVQTAGVHEGNVREWDNIDEARRELIAGAQSYMTARTKGLRSSKNWFTTNLSNVSSGDLSQLKDITNEVSGWTVEKESNIRDFVNAKSGGRFEPGVSFFEIMKKEKQIQDYKKLLIQDRATKRIYADGRISVRTLCGLPTSGDVAIDPGNHANFVLFAQSTSTNRILPRGTKLTFWPGANY